MGPQPFGCGRLVNPLGVQPGEALLQWGRNLSVAEGDAPPSILRRQAGCFNGAATFRLRKVSDDSEAICPF